LRRPSEKGIAEGSKYVHLIGLYLSFHLSWVLGSFVYGRLQNLKTSKDTFGHGITSLRSMEFRNFINLHKIGCQEWIPSGGSGRKSKEMYKNKVSKRCPEICIIHVLRYFDLCNS